MMAYRKKPAKKAADEPHEREVGGDSSGIPSFLIGRKLHTLLSTPLHSAEIRNFGDYFVVSLKSMIDNVTV